MSTIFRKRQDNSSNNKSYNLKIYILFFVVALTTLSCGPRSGVSKSENIDSDQPIDYVVSDKQWCGNAAMDSQNYDWASKTLEIQGDSEHGRKLFKQNCAVCHDIMDREFTGPGLKGLYERIPGPKTTWLKKYITNNLKVHDSGDKYAKTLRLKYPKDTMSVFEYLTEQEINDIMIYVIGNTK